MLFLFETLQNLDENLRECGSRLYVLKGKPLDVLSQVFKVTITIFLCQFGVTKNQHGSTVLIAIFFYVFEHTQELNCTPSFFQMVINSNNQSIFPLLKKIKGIIVLPLFHNPTGNSRNKKKDPSSYICHFLWLTFIHDQLKYCLFSLTILKYQVDFYN